MANLTTREFWAATADRAIKSGAQSAITLIGADAVSILDLNWSEITGVTATMMLLSVLTSIIGDTAGKNGPSFVRSEGIGIENAEAEEALRRERAGEVINTSSAVSFASADSSGDDTDEYEDDPGEVTQEDIDNGEWEDDVDSPRH